MRYKTQQVSQILNVTHHQLFCLFRSKKIPPPEKDCSGDFTWTPEDIDRARAALKIDLRRRPRRQLEAAAR
jgi:hypothetical protein